MSGRSVSQWLSAVFFLIFLLVACQPAGHVIPRQMVVEWAEKRLVFIADERNGSVRAFHLGASAPVFVAQTRCFERATVRDVKLDAMRGQLWVLGAESVYVHDVHGLVLLKRIPLDARDVAEMHIENGEVVLLASGGIVLGHVNTEARLAVWRPALSLRRG